MKKLLAFWTMMATIVTLSSCNNDDNDVASTILSIDLDYSIADYYDDFYTDGTVFEYYVVLSDCKMSNVYQTGGQYYILDLISATAPTSETITIPAGTYTVKNDDGDGVMDGPDSYYGIYGSNGFTTLENITSGSVEVTVSGTTTTIEGVVTDDEGTIHNISYSGEIDVRTSYNYSLITEDTAADLTGARCEADYYGDLLENGTSFWVIQIYNLPGEGFYVVLCSEEEDFTDDTLPAGTYTGAISGEAGTYISGVQYGVYTSYSWYFVLDSNGNKTCYDPLGDGEITVIDNNDGTCTVVVDALDLDNIYSIKAEWTGTPMISDESSTPFSVSLWLRPPSSYFAGVVY